MTMNSELHIPVVMYHSVGNVDPDWLWDDLTMPHALFAAQLERLSARRYRPMTLDELHDRRVAGETVGDRRVVLTFDDGYLDNWVFVYPLLKRAGWRGLVYVNPEFVDPGIEPRPNLEDVWAGRCHACDLPTRGFLNWAELEIMDRSGILQVGCHSMSHTWYPCGPEIVDFHRPGLSTPWLAWNARPDRKSFYLSEDQTGFVPFGTPIHRNGRSLGVRRYFPDPAQAEAAVAHVATRGGAAYFDSERWREELLAVVTAAGGGKGRHETDEEMLGRYRYEIEEARRVLEQHLSRPILHFCWPGGAYNDTSWDIAEKTGFRTITVKRSDAKRWWDPSAQLVRRIANHQHYSLLGKRRATNDPEMLVLACEVALGRRGARMALVARKALNAAGLIPPAG